MAPKEHRPTLKNYRKPPPEHQFRKGQSGNPNGRPRKKLASSSVPGFDGGIHDMLQAVVLSEALRPIIVREGDKVTEMSALEALVRSNFRIAAQGDAKAARQLLEVVARAETSRTANAKEMLEFVAAYKARYEPIFAQHEKDGLEPPEVYPHPDDIIVDPVTGAITFDGPMDKDQAGAQKAFEQIAIQKLSRFFAVETELKNNPKNVSLGKEFKELKIYDDYIRKVGKRNIRLAALRVGREALHKDISKQKPKAKKRRGEA